MLQQPKTIDQEGKRERKREREKREDGIRKDGFSVPSVPVRFGISKRTEFHSASVRDRNSNRKDSRFLLT